jgi:hypothetical protein
MAVVYVNKTKLTSEDIEKGFVIRFMYRPWAEVDTKGLKISSPY